MKRVFRQKFSLILAAAMLITSCPVLIFADDEITQMEQSAETQAEMQNDGQTEESLTENQTEEDSATTTPIEELGDFINGIPEAVENAIDTLIGGEETPEGEVQEGEVQPGESSSEEIGPAFGPAFGPASESAETGDESLAATPSSAEYTDEMQNVSELAEEMTGEAGYVEVENVEEKVATSSDAEYFDCTSEAIDGIKVTVTAEAGVFPAGSKLSVKKVSVANKDARDIEKAVDNAKLLDELTNDGTEESESGSDDEDRETYTFDIKVLDGAGHEVQPADESKVTVKFEKAVTGVKPVTDAKVYHIEETDETKIEKLEAIVNKAEETAEKAGSIEAADNAFDYSLLDGDVIDNVNEKHSKIDDTAAKLIEAQESGAISEAEAEEAKTYQETDLVAAELDTAVTDNGGSNVVVTATDGFSYYVVEFYYGEDDKYEYVLSGDGEVKLQTILDTLGVPVNADTLAQDDIEVSDNTLFATVRKAVSRDAEESESGEEDELSKEAESGEENESSEPEETDEFAWYVVSKKPFSTNEWMKITVKGEDGEDNIYEIKVTDESDNVASVIHDSVENQYATLAAAVSAAVDGDTVKVLKDITLDEQVVIKNGDAGKELTLDLAGNKITATSEQAIYNRAGSVLTIIDSDEGGKISGNIRAVYNLGTLTIEGGTITGNVGMGGSCKLKITGGTVTGGIVDKNGNQHCGIVTLDTDGGTLPDSDAGATIGDVAHRVALYKMTYTLPEPKKDGAEFGGWVDGNKIYKAGDDFTLNSGSKTLKAKWCAVEVESSTGAKTYYETLKQAVDAAVTGDTVKPLGDITLKSQAVVDAGKEITLDLNGKIITVDEAEADKALYNKGTLTITDSDSEKAGKITGSSTGVYNMGTLTVIGGTITGVIDNRAAGKLKVIGGTIGNVTTAGSVAQHYGIITFDADGGTLPDSDTLATIGTVAQSVALYNMTYALPEPEKTGAEFGGWVDGNKIYKAGDEYTLNSGSKTLKAKWCAVEVESSTGTKTYYETLRQAVDAAVTGDTVRPLDDITLKSQAVVDAGKEITLDLNGKIITVDKDETDKALYNKGTLTITDSDSDKAGKITGSSTGVYNTGTLTVTGGTITGVIDNRAAGKLKVIGGTIGNVTTAGSVAQHYGIITFDTDGGILSDSDAGAIIGGEANKVALYKLTYTLPTVTKTGEIFAGWNDGSKTYAAGTEYALNDGTKTLTAQWATVEVTTSEGKKYYATLKEALKAATSGQTVKLLEDSDHADVTYAVPVGVTLDVAGKKLMAAYITLKSKTENDVTTKAELIDTENGTGAVIVKNDLLKAGGNLYMPLYDPSISTEAKADGTKGYRLYKYGYKFTYAREKENKKDVLYVINRIYLYNSDGTTENQTAYELLSNTQYTDGSGNPIAGKLLMTTTITAKVNGKKKVFKCDFDSEDVQSYGSMKAKGQDPHFDVKLINYTQLEDTVIKMSANWKVSDGYTFSDSPTDKYKYVNDDGTLDDATKDDFDDQFE